jgi:hypothetical protein
VYILLTSEETRKLRKQLLSTKCRVDNKELAYKETINCTKAVGLRNIGSYVYKIRCKWEKKSGIYNWNWGGGNRTVVIRMSLS